MHWKTTRVVSPFEAITLCVADDIVVNAKKDEKADYIETSMTTICQRHRMEIGPDNKKRMTNNPNVFQRKI